MLVYGYAKPAILDSSTVAMMAGYEMVSRGQRVPRYWLIRWVTLWQVNSTNPCVLVANKQHFQMSTARAYLNPQANKSWMSLSGLQKQTCTIS